MRGTAAPTITCRITPSSSRSMASPGSNVSSPLVHEPARWPGERRPGERAQSATGKQPAVTDIPLEVANRPIQHRGQAQQRHRLTAARMRIQGQFTHGTAKRGGKSGQHHIKPTMPASFGFRAQGGTLATSICRLRWMHRFLRRGSSSGHGSSPAKATLPVQSGQRIFRRRSRTRRGFPPW